MFNILLFKYLIKKKNLKVGKKFLFLTFNFFLTCITFNSIFAQNIIKQEPAYEHYNKSIRNKEIYEKEDGYYSQEESAYNSATGLDNEFFNSKNKIPLINYTKLNYIKYSTEPNLIQIYNFPKSQNLFNDENIRNKNLITGILFTYKNITSKEINILGNFTDWFKQPFKRGKFGVFYYFYPLLLEESKKNKTKIFKYKFEDDGLLINDPKNVITIEDGVGSYISVYNIEKEIVNTQTTVKIIKEKNNSIAGITQISPLIEFAIHLPKNKNVSLVGSFNNWNPEHNKLTQDKKGIFKSRIRLNKGNYVYKYIVDGKWVLDTFNSNTRYSPEINELCSYLEVK